MTISSVSDRCCSVRALCTDYSINDKRWKRKTPANTMRWKRNDDDDDSAARPGPHLVPCHKGISMLGAVSSIARATRMKAIKGNIIK